MSNDYYIDIVTKNILSTLSAHISETVSAQLKTVMNEAASQLEARILKTIDSLAKSVEDQLTEVLQSKKSMTDDSLNESVKTEINRIEALLSTNKMIMLTLLKAVFESELRSADLLAERVQNNKKELRDTLKGLEKLFESSSHS
ncbi:MAG: hypothetical protein HQK92_09070 [Nitrospirae bacterium]|nr:hypothetical protein [Nitrospirota bacterium]